MGPVIRNSQAGHAEAPGAVPREAPLVRQWGLENGWKEVAVKLEVGEGFPTILSELPERPQYTPGEQERQRGFIVFAPDRNEIYPLDQPPAPDEVSRGIKGLAFPGETEGLVVDIYALSDLEAVALELTDLKGPGGAVIRSSPSVDKQGIWTKGMLEKTVALPDITVRDVIYAPVSLWTRVQDERLFSMLPLWLLPHKPEALKAGESRLFWLTIHCPSNCPPGLYQGALTLSVAGEVKATGSIELEMQPFELDGSLCSWGPVTATSGFNLAVFQQLAEHHMTCLSWWWDDWGLTVTREGDRASFDPRPLDLLNAVTREAGMRGPWIILLGSMTNGQLERRIASSGLFDVKMVRRPEAPPDAPPTVGDLSDEEMNRRYVEVLQSLAKRARQKGYPEIILIVYDEPTRYLFDWHAHRCALIHKHVPELKVLSTPQGEFEWARNLMSHSDYMVVRGYNDPICELTRKAGKGIIGFGRLAADMDFALARWDMGLRFAQQQPGVIFFWALNYGALDPQVPFNDLVTPKNWGFRHRFAWPPTENSTLEPSLGKGQRWIETVVWEAQREGAKDYLLLLMLERELSFSTSREAEGVRKELQDFKSDSALHAGDLDGRRAKLVAWYRKLTGK